MGTRPGRSPHALSTGLAIVLTVGMVAGVAAASPDAFQRAVSNARRVLDANGAAERAGERSDPDVEGASGSTVDDTCGEILAAYHRAAPPSDDAHALARAIEVVRENCQRNPQARGLVVAFQRLIERVAHRGADGPPGLANDRGGGHGPGRPDGVGAGHGVGAGSPGGNGADGR